MTAKDLGLDQVIYDKDIIPTRRLGASQTIMTASNLLQSTAKQSRKTFLNCQLPSIVSKPAGPDMENAVRMVETSVRVSADLILVLNFEIIHNDGTIVRTSGSPLSHEVLQFQIWLLKNCKPLRHIVPGHYEYSSESNFLVAFFPTYEWNNNKECDKPALLVMQDKLTPFIKDERLENIEFSKAWFQMNKALVAGSSWDQAEAFDRKFEDYYKNQKENGILI